MTVLFRVTMGVENLCHELFIIGHNIFRLPAVTKNMFFCFEKKIYIVYKNKAYGSLKNEIISVCVLIYVLFMPTLIFEKLTLFRT